MTTIPPMTPKLLLADDAVRPEYLSGTWDYARGRVATDHHRYEEACSIADAERWDRGWIRTWVDAVAVVEHGCWFDEAAGQKVCEFFERFLKHSKGRKWNGKPFKLIDWQKYDLIMPLYGWRRPADPEEGVDRETRRFRTAGIWIPKKNGKSATVSGLGLYHLMADGEEGPEVYSAAGDINQARIVHKESANMVRKSAALGQHLRILDSTKRILCPRNGGEYRALSSEAELQEGYNASAVLFDELHVQKKRVLFDTLEGADLVRDEPLFITISTAGVYDKTGIGWEQWEYGRKVREGIVENWEFFALAYYTEKNDDWLDEQNWLKANPSLGVTIPLTSLRGKVRKAEGQPGKQNAIRRYHMNQWTQQAEAWVDIDLWQKCTATCPDSELAGRPCCGGLDLSHKMDLSSFGLAWPPLREGDLAPVKTWSWIPEDNIAKRVRDDKVPYDLWVEQGFIEATPGNVISQAHIRKKINELQKHYNIQEIGFDPKYASQIEGDLGGDGLAMVELFQSYGTFNSAMVEMEKLIKAGLLAHGGNPVLQWSVGNMCVMTNSENNQKPAKKESTERIDPIVAVLMAMSRWLVHRTEDVQVYKGRLPVFI